MNPTLRKILFWMPRVASILFILFVSLFALDVFGVGYNFWETILALLIHLIPTFILVAALLLAWRHEWFGSLLYVGFAGWYIIEMWGRFEWTVYIVMAGIPFLIGVLFAVGWTYRREIRAN